MANYPQVTSEIAFLTRTDISGMSSDVKGQLIVCDIPCEDCRSSLCDNLVDEESSIHFKSIYTKRQISKTGTKPCFSAGQLHCVSSNPTFRTKSGFVNYILLTVSIKEIGSNLSSYILDCFRLRYQCLPSNDTSGRTSHLIITKIIFIFSF